MIRHKLACALALAGCFSGSLAATPAETVEPFPAGGAPDGRVALAFYAVDDAVRDGALILDDTNGFHAVPLCFSCNNQP